MDAADLRDRREDGRFEAKLAAHGRLPKSLWQTYSSFANTNGGVIVLGVAEDKRHTLDVVGVPNAADLVSQFWNNANDGNTVSANILVDDDVRIENLEGKNVIVITVPRAARSFRPVYTGTNPMTGTWRRKGEGDYRCAGEEVRAMLRDQAIETPDATIVEEWGLDVLDQPTVDAYRTMLRARRPDHPWLNLTDDEFLWRLGAADRVPGDGTLHPTRAGLLMFGDERYIAREFAAYLLDFRLVTDSRAQRWDDRLMSSDGTWPGNVFGFWTRVIPKLVDNLPTPFRMPDGITRQDDTPLRKAVREALANTLCHADYLGRIGITVVRHGNEFIEFRNPGCLRLALDIVERGGLSDARNPIIMKMFNLLGIGEKAGSGFDIMRQGTRSAQLPDPQLIEEYDPDRVTLTLSITATKGALNKVSATNDAITNNATAQSTNAAPRQLTEREQQIVSLLSANGPLKASQIAQAVGLSGQWTRALLKKLSEDGTLVKQGNNRSTMYRSR